MLAIGALGKCGEKDLKLEVAVRYRVAKHPLKVVYFLLRGCIS